MGVIKQKHEQKSDKRDISRMSRTVVMTRELVRVLVIAVATMVCVGGYKDISAAGESNTRADLQSKIDAAATEVNTICEQTKKRTFFVINEALTFLAQFLTRVQNDAHSARIPAIVKQCNGAFKKLYQCLTDSLVFTLTDIVIDKSNIGLREELRILVDSPEWQGDISAIPKSYIRHVQHATNSELRTFNFNLEREMREGLARDMNAAILRAADVYNKALEAEGGDALKKFGIQLSPAQLAAVKSMAAAPREAVVSRPPVGQPGPGAKFSDPDFERRLERQDPNLYQKYKGILADINLLRWGALYLATLQPKQEELLLFTRDGEKVPLDYVGKRLEGTPQRIEAGIAALAGNKDVQDHLQKVYKTAEDEIRENLSIWEQATGQGVPSQQQERDIIGRVRQAEEERIAQERAARAGTTPTPISGGGAPPSGVSQPESGLARMEREERGERQRLLVEARTLVDDLSRAVEKAKLVTGNVLEMQATHRELSGKYDRANKYLQSLEIIGRSHDTDLLKGVMELNAHPAFKSALEQMRRISAAIQNQQQQLQPTSPSSPVVGGGAGTATPPSEPQIEPTVGNLPQSVYNRRFAELQQSINSLRQTILSYQSATSDDIEQLRTNKKEIHEQFRQIERDSISLHSDSGQDEMARALLSNVEGTLKNEVENERKRLNRIILDLQKKTEKS